MAYLGYKSLDEIRGKTDFITPYRPPDLVGRIDLTDMLVETRYQPKNPKYLEEHTHPMTKLSTMLKRQSRLAKKLNWITVN